jgi:hypothetical protein
MPTDVKNETPTKPPKRIDGVDRLDGFEGHRYSAPPSGPSHAPIAQERFKDAQVYTGGQNAPKGVSGLRRRRDAAEYRWYSRAETGSADVCPPPVSAETQWCGRMTFPTPSRLSRE